MKNHYDVFDRLTRLLSVFVSKY